MHNIIIVRNINILYFRSRNQKSSRIKKSKRIKTHISSDEIKSGRGSGIKILFYFILFSLNGLP